MNEIEPAHSAPQPNYYINLYNATLLFRIYWLSTSMWLTVDYSVYSPDID